MTTAMQLNQKRFSMILHCCPTGICLINRRHEVEFANPAWAKMHGYTSVAELIGQPLHAFHTDAQMKQEMYPFLEMVEWVGRCARMLGRRRNDGSEFSIETLAMLVHDEDNAVVGYVLYAGHLEINQQQAVRERSLCSSVLDSPWNQ